jgi:hypothetical protein
MPRPQRRQRAPLTHAEAKLVLRLYNSDGWSRGAVAKALDCDITTIRAILRFARENDGAARLPRHGKGKVNDRRWIFAGPDGRHKQACDDSLTYKEVWSQFVCAGAKHPGYSTLCHALAEHLDYSIKLLSTIANERDELNCLHWRHRVQMAYHPKQLVCLDESAADNHTLHRRYGSSKRGTIAKTNYYYFHRGVRYSVLGPFVMDEGFLDSCIIEGGFNSDTFLEALVQVVLPHMNAFPDPRSVLLLDNCIIHRQYEVVQAVHDIGAIVLFLEPYDPVSMPVEIAYRCMKSWLKRNGRALQEAGVDGKARLRMAMQTVGRESARNAFHTAGYFD